MAWVMNERVMIQKLRNRNWGGGDFRPLRFASIAKIRFRCSLRQRLMSVRVLPMYVCTFYVGTMSLSL